LQKSNFFFFFFFFFNLQGDLGMMGGEEKRWQIKTHTGVEAACIWVRRSCSWSFISCIWLVLWCKPVWSNFTCIVKSKVPIGSLILMSTSPYNSAHMDWIHGKDCSFDSFIEGFSFRRWMISRNMYKIANTNTYKKLCREVLNLKFVFWGVGATVQPVIYCKFFSFKSQNLCLVPFVAIFSEMGGIHLLSIWSETNKQKQRSSVLTSLLAVVSGWFNSACI
jgi:hypothetical protein